MLWPTTAITRWLLNKFDAIGNLDVVYSRSREFREFGKEAE